MHIFRGLFAPENDFDLLKKRSVGGLKAHTFERFSVQSSQRSGADFDTDKFASIDVKNALLLYISFCFAFGFDV